MGMGDNEGSGMEGEYIVNYWKNPAVSYLSTLHVQISAQLPKLPGTGKPPSFLSR